MPVMSARLPFFSGKECMGGSPLATLGAVLEEPGVRALETLAEPDLVVPPERVKPRHIEELPGRTVGLGRVEDDPGARVNDVAGQLGERLDGEVVARADVYVLDLLVVLHEVDAGRCEVVGVQE